MVITYMSVIDLRQEKYWQKFHSHKLNNVRKNNVLNKRLTCVSGRFEAQNICGNVLAVLSSILSERQIYTKWKKNIHEFQFVGFCCFIDLNLLAKFEFCLHSAEWTVFSQSCFQIRTSGNILTCKTKSWPYWFKYDCIVF